MTELIFQKEMDNQGRIILPKEWRSHLKSNKVIIIMEDHTLKIIPKARTLSSFIPKAKPSTLKSDPFQNYEQALAEANTR